MSVSARPSAVSPHTARSMIGAEGRPEAYAEAPSHPPPPSPLLLLVGGGAPGCRRASAAYELL